MSICEAVAGKVVGIATLGLTSLTICRCGRFMKRETAELLAKTFVDLLGDLGLDIPEVVSFALAMPLDDHAKAWVQGAHRDGLANQLEALPEWSEEQVSAALAAAEQMRTSTQFLREKLKEILRGLPRTPKGPERVIPRDREPQVCAEFDALIRAGCERADATERVAQRYGASERTVYRILKEHGRARPRKPRKTAIK